jgi:hypothetical protein
VRGLDFTVDDEDTYVMVVPDGHPLQLTGVGALIWDCAVSGDDVLDQVTQATGASRAEIEHDVRVFLDDLVQRDLLIRADAR